MLLVTGDLIVDGSFQFTGIVAVRGRVVVTGSGPQDQKTITGTLLVGG
jgi:cytoskeletal protein CcmA (bactofilin family)